MLEFVENWHMDYVGQARAEKLSRIILIVMGLIGWVGGYVNQQFSLTVFILGAGLGIASLITMPPWPMYRKNPLNWQPVKNKDKEAKKKVTASKKSK